MPPQIALVTGANRGLGLALTKALLARTSLSVVAACRDPSNQTAAILDGVDEADEPRVCILPLDVTDEESIRRAAANVQEQFGGKSLRVAFNNAGILHAEKALKQCEYEDVLQTFRVNTLGPLFMAKHFVPLLAGGMMGKVAEGIEEEDTLPPFGVFASISARTGSISDNNLGGWYSYRASKAAQNQITRTIAHELKNRKLNAVAVALHPGTVKTDLSAAFVSSVKPEKLFSPEQAANYLLDVVARLRHEDNGGFLAWDGKPIPF